MSDTENDPLSEFGQSIPLKRFHRYAVGRNEQGVFGAFGLQAEDDSVTYFSANADVLWLVSNEIEELGRAARFIERKPGAGMPIPMHRTGQGEFEASGIANPFSGSVFRVNWANVRLCQLDELIRQQARFTKFDAHKIREESGLTEWEFRVTPYPPASIPLLIGEVIHHARSALDLAMCDAATVRGRSRSDVFFPFAKSEPEFDAFIASPKGRAIRKVGPEVSAIIRSYKPWVGGNTLLRGLHDLDVSSKHRLLVPAYYAVKHRVEFERMAEAFAAKHKITDPVQVLNFGGPYVHFHHGQRVTTASGADPFAFMTKVESGLEPRFSNIAKAPFAAEPILPKLDQMVHLSWEIMMAIRKAAGISD